MKSALLLALLFSPSVLFQCYLGVVISEELSIPLEKFPIIHDRNNEAETDEIDPTPLVPVVQKSAGVGKLFFAASGALFGAAASLGVSRLMKNSTTVIHGSLFNRKDLDSIHLLQEKIEEKDRHISALGGDLKQRKIENEQLHGIISQLKQKLSQFAREKEVMKKDFSSELVASKNETKKLLGQQKQRLEKLAAEEKEKLQSEASAEIDALKHILQEIKLKEKDIIRQEVKRVQEEMASILEEERQELKQHMMESIAKLKSNLHSNSPKGNNDIE